MSTIMELAVYSSEKDWKDALLSAWQQAGSTALSARGTFLAGLSGGDTVLPMCQALAKTEWPWSSTQLFLNDELWFPPDHPKSRYQRVYAAFYPHKVRLNRWKTESNDPARTAVDYANLLKKEAGELPRLDLVILDMGDNGQLPGLFPESPTLAAEAPPAMVSQNPRTQGLHLAITLPVIRRAREVWLLSKGKAMESTARKISQGNGTSPASLCNSEQGRSLIFHCAT